MRVSPGPRANLSEASKAPVFRRSGDRDSRALVRSRLGRGPKRRAWNSTEFSSRWAQADAFRYKCRQFSREMRLYYRPCARLPRVTGPRRVACWRPAATASCEPHLYQGHYVAKNEIMRYKFLFTGLNGPPQGPRAGRRRRSMGRPPNGARKTEEHHRAAPGAVMRFRVSAPQDEVVGSYFLLESLVTY